MAWKPKREKCHLLPEGEWGVVIANVEQKTFKSGNSGVEMTYSAKWAEKTVTLKDYLVGKWGAERSRAIAVALGKTSEYDAGTFRLSKQIDAHLWVLVKHENHKDFGWSARIKDYLDCGPEGPPPPVDPLKYKVYDSPEECPF